MESGIVFNIQRFCINDGPGIRTTVFLKGCPLDCIWCHNPESKSPDVERSFRDPLEVIGEKLTAAEVVDEVIKDEIFFDSSLGGVTLSGGEPMMQFGFSMQILKLAGEKGINTCVETCGFADAGQFEEILPFVDTFLYDYKITNEALHKKYTGVSNKEIIENLHFLDKRGADIILRCPVIPTINDNDEHFEGIIRIANSLKNIREVNILPYHPMGIDKAEGLGKKNEFPEMDFPTDETVNGWISQMSKRIKVPVIL